MNSRAEEGGFSVGHLLGCTWPYGSAILDHQTCQVDLTSLRAQGSIGNNAAIYGQHNYGQRNLSPFLLKRKGELPDNCQPLIN
jgi:hypothetical protein